ncbi:GNAT family N-acetyltransferase [Paenibacillus sp. 1011MAR3C5]|uniref:GNAT family N-acetyltransferase n=1 Tax=Paenibacillus sp. 1011MAR3C5 TaxID=1675787 RepID=UPI000E6D1C81|nr:GNAT family N-acetyltransferase [Paenibacillus sp. 1011MAR3C5]RJE86932.1 GNAT family N-acetyltransferase [Paenibacillus sp. 1011MAR3C5]
MIRLLKLEEMDAILAAIDRERHFLYYSYLTTRRSRTIQVGHYSANGELLLGVLAYLRGMPFHAFSVYPVHETFRLKPLMIDMQERLKLPQEAVGSCMVNEEDKHVLEEQLETVSPAAPIMLMKHRHPQALPPADEQVVRLEPGSYSRIESRLAEWNTMAFTREELEYPFYGIWSGEELIALGGYHIYSEDYVELGNIGTDANWRNRGYGRRICAQLTRTGKAISGHVYLNVVEGNASAIRLYRSLGFETVCLQHIVQFKL